MGLDPGPLAREAALHTALEAVGGLAARAGVETLALVRLRPPPVYDVQITSVVEETFPGRVLVPDDAEELVP
jgi:ribonuclease BN (tRNA processing enzyme)